MEDLTEQYMSLLPSGLFVAMGSHSDELHENILSEAEAGEYREIRHSVRKEEFLSTRGLIKQLAETIGLDGAEFEVHKDGLGKPFGIYRDRRYYLSLAHTGRTLLCGISPDIPVGIDLEPVDREVDDRLRERMLHPGEREPLKKVPLIRIWTLKEALVKLEGKGLRTNLNRIRIRPRNQHEFDGRFNDDKSAIICSFQHDGYWISVAYFKK